MEAANILLLSASFLLILMLLIQTRVKARKTPCTFIFGGVFLILFAVFPLILHATSGYALSVKASGKTGLLIRDSSVYLIYAVHIFIFSVLYCASVLSAYFTAKNKAVSGGPENELKTHAEAPNQAERFLYVASGLVALAGLLTYFAGTGMPLSELLTASRFEWYKHGTKNTLLLNLGHYFLAMLAVYAYYDVKLRFPRKWLSILVYTAIIVMIMTSGGRKWILFLGSGILAGYFDRKGKSFPVNMRMLMFGALLFLLAFSWQFGRTVSWHKIDSIPAVGQQFVDRVPKLFARGDATYFYRSSLDAIRLNKDEGTVFPLAVVRRIVFLPLPDTWTMGLKPEGMPFLFADRMDAGTEARRGNLPPGLLGLFVLSFGWLLSIAAFPLLVVPVLRGSDKLVTRNRGLMRSTFFASFLVSMILFMRGSTGGIYFLVFNLLVTFAVIIVYKFLHETTKCKRIHEYQAV